MERLDMRLVQDVVFRLRSGQSERGIAADLGISRVTVREYREKAAALGYLAPDALLPDAAAVEAALGEPVRPPAMVSSVEPYRDLIVGWRKEKLEMVAIHRRLTEHHSYKGTYSSVKRFVHQLEPPEPRVVIRMETPPGKQAQTDFGTVGQLLDETTGKERTAYCFVMVLSYSRHMYLEFTFDQTIPTWVRCHRNAFDFFGGVVEEEVIDNLKAAVLKAALEDPTLSVPSRQMAQHYGYLIHPCRPRTPEHKGKTESGVHYVQRNFWPVACPRVLGEANQKGIRWVMEVAGVRDHGTTHQPPLQRFREHEQAALRPLPAQPFELLEVLPVILHNDCHATIDYSYYSAPHQYVGQELDAYIWERIVQLYDGVTLLTTHPRARERGEWHTRTEHLPAHKVIYLERTPKVCREMAAEVGPHCVAVLESILEKRPADNLRAAQALVGLSQSAGAERLEAACRRAVQYGDPRYRRVKSILGSGMEQEMLPGMDLGASTAKTYTHARPSAEFFPAESEEERC